MLNVSNELEFVAVVLVETENIDGVIGYGILEVLSLVE